MSERDETPTLATLQREVSLLTAAVGQVVTAMDTQGALLRALLEAVTGPATDDSLTDALARIASALEGQSEQLAAILASLQQASDHPPR